VAAGEGEAEGGPECVAEAVSRCGEAEARCGEGVGDAEGARGVAEPEPLDDGEVVSRDVAVPLPDERGDGVTVPLVRGEALALGEGVLEGEPLPQAVLVRDVRALPDAVPLAHALAVAARRVGEALPQGEDERDPAAATIEALPVPPPPPPPPRSPALALPLPAPLRVVPAEREGGAVALPEAHAEGDGGALCVPLPLPVAL
jgi:hypothetical protein